MSTRSLFDSRFRRAAAGVAVAAAAVVAFSSVGGAIPVSGGISGGFEIDGNLAFDNLVGATVDWSNVGGVMTTVDDTADSGFRGSSKELEPSQWTCNNGGANPGKGDLQRTYMTARTIDNDVYLDLSFIRRNASGQGDVHVNFEFNQAAQPAEPTFPAPGGGVACPLTRSEDDLLVTYDFPGGADNPDIRAWQWDPTQLTEGNWVELNGVPAATVKAAVNQVAIVDPLNGNAAIGVQRFGETSLNLSALLRSNQTPCLTFGRANTRTRSSGESFSSALQDRLPGMPFVVSTCGSLTIVKETDPDGGTGFEYDPSDGVNGGDNFFLDDDQSETFDVEPGVAHTVTEIIPAGYDLEDITCVGDGEFSIVGNELTVTLDIGETLMRRFFVTRRWPGG